MNSKLLHFCQRTGDTEIKKKKMAYMLQLHRINWKLLADDSSNSSLQISKKSKRQDIFRPYANVVILHMTNIPQRKKKGIFS